jgi:hypothetical protein
MLIALKYFNNLIKYYMKKFITTCLVAFIISTPSYATGFFVGADALMAHSRQTSNNPNGNSGPTSGIVKEDNNINYGLNAGYRLDCKLDCMNLYQSVELFYDNLNVASNRFASPNSISDRVEIQNRYGAKFNLGFEVTPKIIPFVTLGVSNIAYANSGNGSSVNLEPLYGVGLLMSLNHGVALKLAYDYQSFNIPSAQGGARIRDNLGVARVGLVYNFSL